MRRLVLLLALLAVAVPTASLGGAAGGDPRREKERLNAADMALAKRVVLRQAELGAGWKRVATPPDDDEPFSCPGYRPDFSAFTITGKAEVDFEHPSGTAVSSMAEVYPSATQAAGDFRTGTKPGVARCLRHLLEKALAEDQTGGVSTKVVSAARRSAPKLAQRAAAYRVVVRVTADQQTVPIYFDVLVFQKGRSLSALMAISIGKPFAVHAALARRIAARMR